MRLRPKRRASTRAAARSEHRECGALKHTEWTKVHGFGRMRQGETQLRHGNQRAGDRCPQSEQQQDRSARRHNLHDGRGRRRRRQQAARINGITTAARRSTRPAPGSPHGNVENSLCTSRPAATLPRFEHTLARPKSTVSDIPLSRGAATGR